MTMMRGPEIGLVMLRGRMGATGNAFNVGETTVTRCTVRLASGTEGHAYVQGRNGEHAKRAALCDALFQEQPERLKTCAHWRSMPRSSQRAWPHPPRQQPRRLTSSPWCVAMIEAKDLQAPAQAAHDFRAILDAFAKPGQPVTCRSWPTSPPACMRRLS